MATTVEPLKLFAGGKDEAFVRKALSNANGNALRLALYQALGDPALAGMSVIQQPYWGGAFTGNELAPEHREEVQERALAYLAGRPQAAHADVSDAEARTMMELFLGRSLTEAEFGFGLEELSFSEFPRGVEWDAKPDDAVIARYHVLVIGAGLGGIAAAIQLKRLGIPFTIIDRNPGAGGTWWINDYPEARVDIASHHYQYSFEKNYPWKHHFATQSELKDYVEHCARKYGVHDAIRFHTALTDARWDDAAAQWVLQLDSGGRAGELRVNAVISAAGLFNAPNLPDIPGIESFKGRMFHTTAWDHSYDYAGKKVGLIGNGSTGCQLMPGIAPVAESMTIFQRSPGWIMGVPGYRDEVTEEAQWLFDNMPYYWNWYCYSIFETMFGNVEGMQNYDPEWQAKGGLISPQNDKLREILKEYLASKLGEHPDLLAKSTPDFPPYAKRLIVDNGWFDALTRPNVHLVTEGIERITPHGVLTKDGVEHELDMIVLGAGFKTGEYLWPVRYEGRDGVTLEDLWKKDGARSYLGTVVPNFPNLFILYGPNGQARAGGLISWLEIWGRYAVKSIVKLIENGKSTMEVRRDVYDDYNRDMDIAMQSLIWEIPGQKSYYVNEFGRSGVNMPWLPQDYYNWMRHPNLDDYNIR